MELHTQRPKKWRLAVSVIAVMFAAACQSSPHGSSGGTSGGVGSTQGSATPTTTPTAPVSCDSASLRNIRYTDESGQRMIVGDGCWPSSQRLWLLTYTGDYRYAESVQVKRTGPSTWSAQVAAFNGMLMKFVSGGDQCAASMKKLTRANSRYGDETEGCLLIADSTTHQVCDPPYIRIIHKHSGGPSGKPSGEASEDENGTGCAPAGDEVWLLVFQPGTAGKFHLTAVMMLKINENGDWTATITGLSGAQLVFVAGGPTSGPKCEESIQRLQKRQGAPDDSLLTACTRVGGYTTR